MRRRSTRWRIREPGSGSTSPDSTPRAAGGSAWWCSVRRRRWAWCSSSSAGSPRISRSPRRPRSRPGRCSPRISKVSSTPASARCSDGEPMPLVNFTTREITCKLVYYGPGRCGKTTNLLYIHGRVPENRRGMMVSLATQSDRTLFFDFLPPELGGISGFTPRFPPYPATGRLALEGADGFGFVVDSQARRFDDNLESFQNLQENLLAQGVDIRQVPIVLQYNKQDLPPDLTLSPAELDDAFNFRGVPSLPADALHGSGVFETLKALSGLVLQRLAARPAAS